MIEVSNLQALYNLGGFAQPRAAAACSSPGQVDDAIHQAVIKAQELLHTAYMQCTQSGYL